MTSILKNFVTVRGTQGDVLTPTEYRSIVEMIKGILDQYNFIGLSNEYKSLLEHVVDFATPHHENDISFFDTIVAKTYDIYVDMLAVPLSFEAFKTDIVPTLGFIELIRRIMLNHYLYNQVKLPSGAVPLSATVYLSDDWVKGLENTPVTLTFPSSIDSETDFIKMGWNKNTTPVASVFSAHDLMPSTMSLPIVFDTDSSAQYFFNDNLSLGYPVPLGIASNDLTIRLNILGAPLDSTLLFSLRNGVDTLTITMNPDRTLVISLNNGMLLQTPHPSSDGWVDLVITSKGYMSLKTRQDRVIFKQETNFILTKSIPFASGLISVAHEDLTKLIFGVGYFVLTDPDGTPLEDTDGSILYDGRYPAGFGLRDLVIYRGYVDSIPVQNLNIPVGYEAIVDPDGAVLFDAPGIPLMSATIDTIPSNALRNDQGGYVFNSLGGYVLVPSTTTGSETNDILLNDQGGYVLNDRNDYVTT